MYHDRGSWELRAVTEPCSSGCGIVEAVTRNMIEDVSVGRGGLHLKSHLEKSTIDSVGPGRNEQCHSVIIRATKKHYC